MLRLAEENEMKELLTKECPCKNEICARHGNHSCWQIRHFDWAGEIKEG